jgi:hypothetical protein
VLSVGPIITLHGRITAREYVDSLGNHVHPTFKCYFLPNNDAVLQGDKVPIHTAELFNHGLKSMMVNFIFPGSTESFCSVLETRVRNQFSPPTFLKQLEDVLQEEWYKIPLETVQNLYESIPSKTAAVLEAKHGPTPY